MENENPFEKFIVDENAPLDRVLVSEIVEPYLESIGKNKIIKYKDKFEISSFWIKVGVYLCIRKIMVESEIIEEEKVGPKEIAVDMGINPGTAKNISKDKTLKKFISNESGKYYIRNHDLKKFKKLLENETSTSK